jgi:hypothetical protein
VAGAAFFLPIILNIIVLMARLGAAMASDIFAA